MCITIKVRVWVRGHLHDPWLATKLGLYINQVEKKKFTWICVACCSTAPRLTLVNLCFAWLNDSFRYLAEILEENGGQKANCCDAVRDPFFFVCFG